MQARNFFLACWGVALGMIALPALLVVVVDPFFVFHPPTNQRALFSGSDRLSNAGLINSFLSDRARGFDTIVIGTSMSQNFPDKPQVMRLTLAGGRGRELRAVAEAALATGNVKRVVWEVFTSYRDDGAADMHPDAPLPLYLYNQSRLDDWRYIINNDVVEEAISFARGDVQKRRRMGEMYRWGEPAEFAAFNSAAKRRELRAQLQQSQLPFDAANATAAVSAGEFANIEANLLPILRAATERGIKIDLYFPPVSYLAYGLMGQDSLKREMRMRRWLVEETSAMPNIAVFGLDNITSFGGALGRYRDMHHYDAAASAEIWQLIAMRRGQLRPENFDDYQAQLYRNINQWNINFQRMQE